MTGPCRGVAPAVVVLVCLCGGFLAGGAAAAGSGQSTADGPTAERSLNTTVAEPGETVRVTATVTRDSAGAVDYLDEFDPAFADDASLVSVTANGTPVAESVLVGYPDTIIISVDDAPPGTVVFTYDVTVPETASPGSIHSFDGLAQTEGGADGDEQAPVGGRSTLAVGGGQPTFAVTLSSVPGAVTAGETLTAEARVTNTGLGTGTQQVGFDVNGTRQASTAVTLDPGENESVTFEYGTVPADVPDLDVAVSSANTTAATTVAVTERAFFDILLSSVPDSVTAGDTLTLAATVTNTGEEVGTQTLSFDAEGDRRASRAVTLSAGESESVTFEYETASADVPGVNLTVSSANATAATTVTVPEGPVFEVGLTSVPAAVTVGGEMSAVATVTNVGDRAGTEPVTVSVGGEQVTETVVTLDPNKSDVVPVGYTSVATDAPELAVTVSSAGATATETVTVTEAAFFSVTLSPPPTPVTVGQTVTVGAVVTNLGGTADTQSVTVDIAGERTVDTAVTLAPGADRTVSLDYTVVATDTPELTVTGETGDDSAVATVTAAEPPLFDVEIRPVNGPVFPSETLTLTAVVTNGGDIAATQSLTFAVDGTPQANRPVDLEAGADETVQFQYAPTDTGERTLSVTTANTTAVQTLSVVAPARFEVSAGDNRTVTAGETVTVTFAVENTGGVRGTQTVTLRVDGDPVTTETLTLASSDRETVSHSYTPAVDGRTTLAVATANDSGSVAVSVTADNDTDDNGTGEGAERTDDASGTGFGPGTVLFAVVCALVYGYKQVDTSTGQSNSS